MPEAPAAPAADRIAAQAAANATANQGTDLGPHGLRFVALSPAAHDAGAPAHAALVGKAEKVLSDAAAKVEKLQANDGGKLTRKGIGEAVKEVGQSAFGKLVSLAATVGADFNHRLDLSDKIIGGDAHFSHELIGIVSGNQSGQWAVQNQLAMDAVAFARQDVLAMLETRKPEQLQALISGAFGLTEGQDPDLILAYTLDRLPQYRRSEVERVAGVNLDEMRGALKARLNPKESAKRSIVIELARAQSQVLMQSRTSLLLALGQDSGSAGYASQREGVANALRRLQSRLPS